MTAETKCKPAVILLVEDEVGDQILTQEAFKSLKTPHDLRIVPDGQEALDYLFGGGSYAQSPPPRPDLILLDLNMPRVSGQQVAERIRADSRLRKIPIVVLTTSRRQEDVLQAYGRGVVSFITKPLDFQQFMTSVQDLEYLVKFALAMKSLHERTRVTDRQILRLARRRHQLERLAETMFDRHMQRIEAIFRDRQADPGGADASAIAPAEAATREALVRLANKILQGRPPQPQPAPEGSQRAEEQDWEETSYTARGLFHLACRLESFAEHPASESPSDETKQTRRLP
ncbi:MAG: response regulator [Acidobacteria bacterium]|nr:response regulator [Acidobacteriota bacterium]